MTASTQDPELEELADEARKQVQLEQSERFTMGSHVRELLKKRRNRVAEAWGQEPESADEDMQVLARDIIENKHYHAAPAKPETPVPAAQPTKPSRWPMAAATLLALACPSTAGVVMLPQIIAAWNKPAQVTPAPAPNKPTEYAPILLPGKPAGT